MTEWQPIETFFEQHTPHPLFGGEPVHYDGSVLVYAVEWEGDEWDSPFHPRTGKWGADSGIWIAHTYLGAPCWTADSTAPSDYDVYLNPTHWMPLPSAQGIVTEGQDAQRLGERSE